jgi:hypothetical protein
MLRASLSRAAAASRPRFVVSTPNKPLLLPLALPFRSAVRAMASNEEKAAAAAAP